MVAVNQQLPLSKCGTPRLYVLQIGGVELGAQVAAGVAVGAGGNFFGGAGAYHAAAVNSAFGTHVNDVVGTFYHVHVVLDD